MKKPEILSKWTATVQGVAELAGVDWRTARKWTQRDDFPPHRKSGWRTDLVREYAVKALEDAAEAQTGENSDLKAEKLKLECQRLREVIKREKELAKQAQLDTLHAEGAVWKRDEVLQSWTDRNIRLVAVIQQWQQREAALDGTVEGKRRIDELARRLREDMATEFETKDNEPG